MTNQENFSQMFKKLSDNELTRVLIGASKLSGEEKYYYLLKEYKHRKSYSYGIINELDETIIKQNDYIKELEARIIKYSLQEN
jgi:hypothetical protein